MTRVSIETIEKWLLSQIVPNATLRVSELRQLNGQVLATMSGSAIKIRVVHKRLPHIAIVDGSRNNQNAWLMIPKRNINKGNLQIAHGVDRVIRPISIRNDLSS